MRHRVKVIPLYGEDGEVVEVMYRCLTHETEAIISPWFLRCVREDPKAEIEEVEEL